MGATSAVRRARPRTRVLVIGVALVAALIGTPAFGASVTAADSKSHRAAADPPHAFRTRAATPPGDGLHIHRVTLVTGDQVIMEQDAEGHVVAHLTPASPDVGKPLRVITAGSHVYVMPQLGPELRKRLDPSVFDVPALDPASGRVSFDVTFDKRTLPHPIRGLQMSTPTASGRTIAGAVTVRASYDAAHPPVITPLSLHGVSRIVLTGDGPIVAAAYELHTLTINATTADGAPVPANDVSVMNADDGRRFFAFGVLVDGQWKVSVPAGHYLLLCADGNHLVVHQVTVGDIDTSTVFSMAEGTVRPKLVFGDHAGLNPDVEVIISDDHGDSVSLSVGGRDFPLPLLSPLPRVAAGRVTTVLRDTWGPKGYQPFTYDRVHREHAHPTTRIALALKEVDGIPPDLTFRYHDSDFARDAQLQYATSRKKTYLNWWWSFLPGPDGASSIPIPVARPSALHVRFAGPDDIRWYSQADAEPYGFDVGTSFELLTTAYHAGERYQHTFFRGPITPVADRGDESKRPICFDCVQICPLCISHGILNGNLSMFSSAGVDTYGLNPHSSWALFHDKNPLAAGRGPELVVSNVRHIRSGESLRLTARTRPPDPWSTLSTAVHDQWSFPAPQRGIVPILRADYVPPTNLSSHGPRGPVSFPISFDNLGPIDARVEDASVRWSVDGAHWHAAALTRRDANTFRVSYINPTATRRHRYLSLKVFAEDRAGRSIAESVEHAYVLPAAHARSAAAIATSATLPTAGHRRAFHPATLCRTPGRHRSACFVRLEGHTSVGQSRGATTPRGWGARALRRAYALGIDQQPGTVGVIVSHHYPRAEADMNHYREQYGLPPCTSASGCFAQLNQRGESGNFPVSDPDWAVEAALDLQMVSAACPTCHVILVEADEPLDQDLEAAEQTAVDAGATVTNHSYGRIEYTGTDLQGSAYDHAGVTAVASSGDVGYPYGLVEFPASSPQVVGVGGTVLARATSDPRGWSEKVWADGGSGCSAYFPKPAGQADTGCHGRTVADVSAVALNLAVYDTFLPQRYAGWLRVGGTSASSPLIAGIIASGDHGGLRPSDLYAAPGGFHDVVTGDNGRCQGSYMCTGLPGYDAPTGLGTPVGARAFAVP